MTHVYDPERLFSAEEIKYGVESALGEIYGPGNPLADHITGMAVGRVVFGAGSETAAAMPDDMPYTERLYGIRKPRDLAVLAASAAQRLKLSVASYLSHDSGLVNPYIWDGDDIIGQLSVWPEAEDRHGRSTTLSLKGGPKSPYDPLGENKGAEFEEFTATVAQAQVWDSLSDAHVPVSYLETSHRISSRDYRTNIPMDDPTRTYVFNPYTREGRIVREVFAAADSAIDWYENKYPIHKLSGLTYANVKALGYVDEEGRLLPDWFDRVGASHPELLQQTAEV